MSGDLSKISRVDASQRLDLHGQRQGRMALAGQNLREVCRRDVQLARRLVLRFALAPEIRLEVLAKSGSRHNVGMFPKREGERKQKVTTGSLFAKSK
jgi:hypothetical protein